MFQALFWVFTLECLLCILQCNYLDAIPLLQRHPVFDVNWPCVFLSSFVCTDLVQEWDLSRCLFCVNWSELEQPLASSFSSVQISWCEDQKVNLYKESQTSTVPPFNLVPLLYKNFRYLPHSSSKLLILPQYLNSSYCRKII